VSNEGCPAVRCGDEGSAGEGGREGGGRVVGGGGEGGRVVEENLWVGSGDGDLVVEKARSTFTKAVKSARYRSLT
jgi:hypothetical protein